MHLMDWCHGYFLWNRSKLNAAQYSNGLHDNNAKVFWIALVPKDLNGVIHSWIYL